jgi:hypothetical protein
MARLKPTAVAVYAVVLAYGGGLWLHLLHDGQYSQQYPVRSFLHGLHDATLALPVVAVAVALGLLVAQRPRAGLPGWLASTLRATLVAVAVSAAFGVLAPLHDLLLDGGAPASTADLPAIGHMLRDGWLALGIDLPLAAVATVWLSRTQTSVSSLSPRAASSPSRSS